jgi:hypothetical protein
VSYSSDLVPKLFQLNLCKEEYSFQGKEVSDLRIRSGVAANNPSTKALLDAHWEYRLHDLYRKLLIYMNFYRSQGKIEFWKVEFKGLFV